MVKILKELNREFFKQCGIKGGASRSKKKIIASRKNGKMPCNPGKKRGRPKGYSPKEKQDGT